MIERIRRLLRGGGPPAGARADGDLARAERLRELDRRRRDVFLEMREVERRALEIEAGAGGRTPTERAFAQLEADAKRRRLRELASRVEVLTDNIDSLMAVEHAHRLAADVGLGANEDEIDTSTVAKEEAQLRVEGRDAAIAEHEEVRIATRTRFDPAGEADDRGALAHEGEAVDASSAARSDHSGSVRATLPAEDRNPTRTRRCEKDA